MWDEIKAWHRSRRRSSSRSSTLNILFNTFWNMKNRLGPLEPFWKKEKMYHETSDPSDFVKVCPDILGVMLNLIQSKLPDAKPDFLCPFFYCFVNRMTLSVHYLSQSQDSAFLVHFECIMGIIVYWWGVGADEVMYWESHALHKTIKKCQSKSAAVQN